MLSDSDRRPAPYDELASVYDLLQEDLDVAAWVAFIRKAEADFGAIPSGHGDGASGRPLVLDLGCGTGTVAVELVQGGYDVIGIDHSPDMLDKARARADMLGIGAGEAGLTLVCQELDAFELYGTVDLILCLLDTVNHLTSPERVQRLFALCHQYLNPGGLVLFDVTTPAYYRKTLGNQVFYHLHPDVAMVWDNQYDEKEQINHADITLFLEEEDGRYRRSDTTIEERAYAPEQIRGWVNEAGLRCVAAYGDLDRSPAEADAERVFFVVTKEPKKPEEPHGA